MGGNYGRYDCDPAVFSGTQLTDGRARTVTQVFDTFPVFFHQCWLKNELSVQWDIGAIKSLEVFVSVSRQHWSTLWSRLYNLIKILDAVLLKEVKIIVLKHLKPSQTKKHFVHNNDFPTALQTSIKYHVVLVLLGTRWYKTESFPKVPVVQWGRHILNI